MEDLSVKRDKMDKIDVKTVPAREKITYSSKICYHPLALRFACKSISCALAMSGFRILRYPVLAL